MQDFAYLCRMFHKNHTMKNLRRLFTAIVWIAASIALTGCTVKSITLYAINVDAEFACLNMAYNELVITYAVNEEAITEGTKFSAQASEEWVTIVDTSEVGKIVLSVEENNGDNRTAQITISAPGCITTHTTLLQYGTPPEKANHTLMYYFFGTSLGGFFKTNLSDAATAIETGILGNSNRVVFFRQEGQYSGYIGELKYDVTKRECNEFRIKDITLTVNTITPNSIGEIMAEMAEVAPAERYGIVFAGHGQGWILREILASDSDISAAGSAAAFNLGYTPFVPAPGAEVTRAFGEKNVQVNIPELAEGIEHSGVELDYILFDACFMSNIEAIYDLRNSANYIIASPCEIMGKGFPYNRTLPHLFKDEGRTTDYVGAAESYHIYYRDEYIGNSRCGSIAVYDCSEIESLAEATKDVMKSAKSEYNAKELQTYEGENPHHFYDFGEWVRVVATDDAALQSFNEAMAECIIAKYSLASFYSAYGTYGTYPINLDVYSGVTTSAPSRAYPNGWRTTSWYKDVIALEN